MIGLDGTVRKLFVVGRFIGRSLALVRIVDGMLRYTCGHAPYLPSERGEPRLIEHGRERLTDMGGSAHLTTIHTTSNRGCD